MTQVKAKKVKTLIPTPNFSADAPVNKRYSWGSVQTPITREEVIEWVAALRSGKYNRATGYLSNGNGFCCLGVLAEEKDQLVQSEATYPTLATYPTFTVDGDTCYLRSGPHKYASYIPVALQTRYATMNDTIGSTFEEIANQIEKDFGIVQNSTN